MANCKATAIGKDKTRVKEVHRLGSESASVSAATWYTSAKALVRKDGSGYVEVWRDDSRLHLFEFGPEA